MYKALQEDEYSFQMEEIRIEPNNKIFDSEIIFL